MAEISYILLCHKDVDALVAKAESLTAAGDNVSIHFDANAPRQDFDRLKAALKDNDRVVFARRRRCGWGEWSLVAATIEGIRAAVDAFPRSTHFYLLSGDCMPIKTAEYVHDFLDGRDTDYIESYDFFHSDWIKTGFRDERLIYRHWFNERSQARRFYASYQVQKRLRFKRAIPRDLKMMIGSQWWCLRRRTIESILDFIARRPDIVRFFRTTWIPDETFFQTLVRHLVPGDQIDNRTLTFLMFSDYGMPVTFYNDHFDMLTGQESLFARKVSPEAYELKERLGRLYDATGVEFRLSNEGRQLFAFLTKRGRTGERFAPRFWAAEATVGRERTLMIVACKKWHVAKRLIERIHSASNVHAIEYLFDEEDTVLPDLGGIQSSLEKRTRHRRALIRMLFDRYETDRLLICLDPSNFDLVEDFYADRSETRLLEIECRYSDEYLKGHAMRVGLAGENSTGETFARLLPAIRNGVARESERLRDHGFPHYHRFREAGSIEENAAALSGFLGLEASKAAEIAAYKHLFAD
ncbi:MAG: glycosyl transferase [Silicimonas sp.]|nr:glycosyl transferase [Silicimonas sp.]